LRCKLIEFLFVEELLVPARGYPNLARRRRLAAELRRLREHVGLAEDQATERLGWPSNSKLSRIELGKSGVKLADLHSLLDLYNVAGVHRAELIALAEESRKSGQFQSVGMRLPGELIAFLEAEAEAESIWVWEPLIVPGLLQTENYTRSLLQAWVDRFSLPPGEVDRRIEARRVRQEVLTRDPPVQLSTVMDESVLHRRIGGAAVMREQLDRLAVLSELPHIEIRILPLNGEHLVGTGSFNYLRFRQIHAVPLNDVVAFEHLMGMDEVEDESDVHQYKAVFESLMSNALRSDETRAQISAVANEEWA
jgi:transcriptional regulator with XRE-family HTH domain